MSHNHSTDAPVLADESQNLPATASQNSAIACVSAGNGLTSPLQVKANPPAPILSRESKAGLRRHLLQMRRDMDAHLRAQWDAKIDQQLIEWCKLHQPASIGVYYPIQAEPNLATAYRDLAQAGIALALPVVQGQDLPLRYAAWKPGMPTTPGAMNVPIPNDIQWVDLPEVLLIPCVGHTDLGYRLGYGGGFYDRTLAQTPRPTTIGISYACLRADFAHDEHDIALDFILTGQ